MTKEEGRWVGKEPILRQRENQSSLIHSTLSDCYTLYPAIITLLSLKVTNKESVEKTIVILLFLELAEPPPPYGYLQ